MNKRQRKKWMKSHPITIFGPEYQRGVKAYYAALVEEMFKPSPVIEWLKTQKLPTPIPASVSPSGTIHVAFSR